MPAALARAKEIRIMPATDPGVLARLFSPMVQTIGLLLVSNIFMTFAWYGHLKYTHKPLVLVILASWGIAFVEYCFQVPANRIGYVNQIPAVELKTIQEVITLVVFAAFSWLYLGQKLSWNHAVGFALVAAGVFFVFMKWTPPQVA
jgi:uncharacterized protein (DUF486 family)